MNNRGFTLVELLAVIVLLALLAAIGTYAITGIIKSAKDNNYELLIDQVRDASELYYQECKYGSGVVDCTYNPSNNKQLVTTLSKLVEYGYLKGNSENKSDGTSNFKVVDPRDDTDISSCQITIEFNRKIIVAAKSEETGCPQDYAE